MIVIKAGMKPEGGSIKDVSHEMNRTESNTYLHIQQCETMYVLSTKLGGIVSGFIIHNRNCPN